jgi:hypothetical protein
MSTDNTPRVTREKNPGESATAPAPSNSSSPGQSMATLRRLNIRWTWLPLFFIVTGILFFRQPAAILHPSFVAEDGSIFFKQLYENGFLATLFTRYAGYLHFAPRIVAALCALLPLEHVPVAYALASLLIAGASLTFFFASGFRSVIDSDTIRAVIAVVLAFLPNADSLMRLAYVCWYLLFFLALVTSFNLPRSGIAKWLLFVVAAVSSWSTPLAIICLPVILWRGWKAIECGERVWWFSLALVIIAFPFTAENAPSLLATALHQSDWGLALIHAIGYRVFCYFFLGVQLAQPLPSNGWTLVIGLSLLFAGLCATGAVLASAKNETQNAFRHVPLVIFYYILVCPALLIMRLDIAPDFLGWNERTWLWHQRYFYPSTLLLGVLGGVIYERLFHARLMVDSRARMVVAIFLVGWLSLHALEFRLWDWHPSTSWKHYTRLIRAAETRVQQTGVGESVRIQTTVPIFDFDLAIDRASAGRDHVSVN